MSKTCERAKCLSYPRRRLSGDIRSLGRGARSRNRDYPSPARSLSITSKSGVAAQVSCPPKRRKGAFVSESALHFDGDKPNSVVRRGGRDDHLSQPTCVNRPIPPERDHDATIPEDQRGGALPLFCLAPHGVFRASRITPRAVSSYLAFSTLPDLCCQRTGGAFSVTLSVTAILQLRRPRVLRGMLPYGVRTFLPALCNVRSNRDSH